MCIEELVLDGIRFPSTLTSREEQGLKRLSVRECGIDDELLLGLVKMFPGLEELDVTGNDGIRRLKVLGGLKGLKSFVNGI